MNAVESRIHESLYLVSFINLNAIDAATICKPTDITSANKRIILFQLSFEYYTKVADNTGTGDGKMEELEEKSGGVGEAEVGIQSFITFETHINGSVI
ncbi:MAG: hypothetical protein K8R35_09355 [Bacteroidales bacterium]|nr:hypothetical protein [Bacteroidales bacterium]